MKNISFLTLCFLLGSYYPLFATHIVGGEITLQHIEGENYTLALQVYYDRINTGFNVDLSEPVTVLHIFSKRDNQFLRREFLELRDAEDVVYQNSDCYRTLIQTRRLYYERSISLSAAVFNDPEGYYVVWERCCRNEVITNISQPGSSGMVFYMEFPPVVMEGNPFVNSSPEFPFPDGSLLCVNEPSQLSFTASDADGDSLVYSLGTPWIGNSSRNATGIYDPDTQLGFIQPFPEPYTEVVWQEDLGFDFRAEQPFPFDDTIKDNETRIDSLTGLLQLQPNALGLYVFNIQCDEYRNGVRIGRIRRDFQLLVIDCPENNEPIVSAEYPDEEGMFVNYTSGETASIDVRPGEACFNLYVKDPDFGQRFTVEYLPQNFVLPASLEVMMGQMMGTGREDSVLIPVCWPECLVSEPDTNGVLSPFLMNVVISDNNCPTPARDTLHLSFLAEVENILPELSWYYPDASGILQAYQEGAIPHFDVREGNVCFQVVARDRDIPENLEIIIIPPEGLNPMVFPDSLARITQGNADSLVLEYCWPECLVSNMNNAGQLIPFSIAALARDNNCQGESWDTLTFAFTSEPVFNQPPVLSLSENNSLVRVGDNYSLEILLQDPDNDLLDLSVLPLGFELEDWAMRVEQNGEQGEVRAVLEWSPTCEIVEDQALPMTFTFGVVGVDNSLCDNRLEVVDEIVLNLEEQVFDDSQFLPYNVITPNGDQKNDVFYIDTNPESLEWPGENCDFQFRFIRIYNRWGNLVFSSDDPGFQWDGGNHPTGLYYYEIDYGGRDYKGTVTLRR